MTATALPTELAACCLLKLDRPAEAERLLAASNGHGEWRDYYLGLALAHQGRTSEALSRLEAALARPIAGGAANAALVALLKAEAEGKIARRDWEGACHAAGRGLALDPNNPELKHLLTQLGDRLPVAYLKADRRIEAAVVWEEAQAKNPKDFRVTHSLGLFYFWHAQLLEDEGKGDEAASAWRGAIRNWVALASVDPYWEEWKGERERVFGQSAAKEAASNLRHKGPQLLGRRLGDYQNRYLAENRKDDARRLGALGLELQAELKTAEALRRVADSLHRQGRTAELPLPCGALMLGHLGQAETARNLLHLVETTQTNEPSTEQLRWCLSPWVIPWTMIQERRYSEAIQDLEERLPKKSRPPEGEDLLVTAYLEQGKLLAAAGDVPGAFGVWKTAFGLTSSLRGAKARKELTEVIEETAAKEATRLQREDGRKGVEKAVALLEQVNATLSTQRIKENLSELYATLGIMEGNDESQRDEVRNANAKRKLQKALEINSANGRAKENLSLIVLNEAIDLYNRDRVTESVPLFRQAYQLAPSNARVRTQASQAISQYGVRRWNQGAHIEGDQLLVEALEMDPQNTHARTNLLRG